MLVQSLFCAAVIGLQFWVYGFSMIMSHSSSTVIGNLDLAFLRNTLGYPSQANADIPDILLAAFHFTFVTATAMILAGAILERGRLFPSTLFIFCWTTFVYYFLAYWEWNPNGWLLTLGVYDFVAPLSGPRLTIPGGFGTSSYRLWICGSCVVTHARKTKGSGWREYPHEIRGATFSAAQSIHVHPRYMLDLVALVRVQRR